MYPFGILLTLFLVYSIVKYPSRIDLFTYLFTWEILFAGSRMNYGYFFKINGLEIDYNDILLACLFLLSLYLMITQKNFDKKIIINSLILLFVITLGMLFCQIFPANVKVIDFNHSWDLYVRGAIDQLQFVMFSNQSLLMFVRVIIFVCILIVSYTIFSIENWFQIANNVFEKFKYIIVYGVFEAIAKFILKIPMNEYLNSIFGRGISTGGGLERLQGICREPSYYALALFNFIILSLILGYLGKKNVFFWITIALLLGILSSSFSFFICLVAIIAMWIYLFGERNQKLRFIFLVFTILISAFFIAIIVSPSFLNYASKSSISIFHRVSESVIQIRNGFNGMLLAGENFSSEAARLGGGMMTLRAGLSRPFLGLGIGTAYCVTGLICIFANIGILGLLQWIKLLFVDYGHSIPSLLILIILIPVFLCNDLYTLYDTYYLLIIPIVSISLTLKGNDGFENDNLYIN